MESLLLGIQWKVFLHVNLASKYIVDCPTIKPNAQLKLKETIFENIATQSSFLIKITETQQFSAQSPAASSVSASHTENTTLTTVHNISSSVALPVTTRSTRSIRHWQYKPTLQILWTSLNKKLLDAITIWCFSCTRVWIIWILVTLADGRASLGFLGRASISPAAIISSWWWLPTAINTSSAWAQLRLQWDSAKVEIHRNDPKNTAQRFGYHCAALSCAHLRGVKREGSLSLRY